MIESYIEACVVNIGPPRYISARRLRNRTTGIDRKVPNIIAWDRRIGVRRGGQRTELNTIPIINRDIATCRSEISSFRKVVNVHVVEVDIESAGVQRGRPGHSDRIIGIVGDRTSQCRRIETCYGHDTQYQCSCVGYLDRSAFKIDFTNELVTTVCEIYIAACG